jgi:hypothetical protein
MEDRGNRENAVGLLPPDWLVAPDFRDDLHAPHHVDSLAHLVARDDLVPADRWQGSGRYDALDMTFYASVALVLIVVLYAILEYGSG